jgi:SNF2 family DNA or RNA helicase
MEQDNIDSIQVISLLTKLRQISVHPQVYIQSKKKRDSNYSRADWKRDSTKTDEIVKIINSEKENHGFVIFCNFRDEVEILRERLSKEPTVGAVLTYEGYMNENMRAEVVNKSEDLMAKQLVDNSAETLDSLFRNANSKLKDLPMDIIKHISELTGGNHVVLLAQIQCAGTGLNLQHFDRVIFTTPWWTAALMDQAVGRVQRIGQTNQVHVHHVELEEEANLSLNIDDYMNERIETKRELCNRLLAASDRRVTY